MKLVALAVVVVMVVVGLVNPDSLVHQLGVASMILAAVFLLMAGVDTIRWVERRFAQRVDASTRR